MPRMAIPDHRATVRRALDQLITSGRRFAVLQKVPKSRLDKLVDVFVNPPPLGQSRHHQLNALCDGSISAPAASRFSIAMCEQINQVITDQNVGPAMLSVAQVAAKLQVSEVLIRKLISRGRLQAHRVGRSLRISINSLDLYLDECRVKSPELG